MGSLTATPILLLSHAHLSSGSLSWSIWSTPPSPIPGRILRTLLVQTCRRGANPSSLPLLHRINHTRSPLHTTIPLRWVGVTHVHHPFHQSRENYTPTLPPWRRQRCRHDLEGITWEGLSSLDQGAHALSSFDRLWSWVPGSYRSSAKVSRSDNPHILVAGCASGCSGMEYAHLSRRERCKFSFHQNHTGPDSARPVDR